MTDTKENQAEPERLHYFLGSGKVICVQKDDKGRDMIGEKEINCIVKTGVMGVNQTQIARAQQIMQMRFYKEFADPKKVKVTDVFLYGFSYLGYMSEQEFAPPINPEPLMQVADVPVQ
ncbi:hypothetical protein [Rhizobium phage RHph_X2_28B]|uniref:hypothetical protein n=1 Tax=Rhizobium phage RHph_X2_28B TaxID=2836086 RepID=UPI0023290F78|nr:hypothetical protein PP751_gp058 [Rhizobium phage RHph_X2_28B]QWY83510.1 hypothetical protein [Rhizobium phage RHph_X2_28B]QWY83746.1 hypothetical protein [Rhizobium phage RHph_X3_15]